MKCGTQFFIESCTVSMSSLKNGSGTVTFYTWMYKTAHLYFLHLLTDFSEIQHRSHNAAQQVLTSVRTGAVRAGIHQRVSMKLCTYFTFRLMRTKFSADVHTCQATMSFVKDSTVQAIPSYRH
jgi:hypothetical protein